MDEKKATELVPVTTTQAELPPILVGRAHAGGRRPGPGLLRVCRRHLRALGNPALSKHTQRAYRQDVMDFVQFLGLGPNPTLVSPGAN